MKKKQERKLAEKYINLINDKSVKAPEKAIIMV